jgi:hypothetical protein
MIEVLKVIQRVLFEQTRDDLVGQTRFVFQPFHGIGCAAIQINPADRFRSRLAALTFEFERLRHFVHSGRMQFPNLIPTLRFMMISDTKEVSTVAMIVSTMATKDSSSAADFFSIEDMPADRGAHYRAEPHRHDIIVRDALRTTESRTRDSCGEWLNISISDASENDPADHSDHA